MWDKPKKILNVYSLLQCFWKLCRLVLAAYLLKNILNVRIPTNILLIFWKLLNKALLVGWWSLLSTPGDWCSPVSDHPTNKAIIHNETKLNKYYTHWYKVYYCKSHTQSISIILSYEKESHFCSEENVAAFHHQ